MRGLYFTGCIKTVLALSTGKKSDDRGFRDSPITGYPSPDRCKTRGHHDEPQSASASAGCCAADFGAAAA